MGLIKQGILGGFRGKVGSVVGTSWKGLAVMKAMPLSVANPRTAGQVMQRDRFTTLTKLASSILATMIKPLWDRFASGMSGYNAFISANQSAFATNGSLDPYKLVMSRGRLIAPTAEITSAAGSTATVTVTNPVGDRFALPTDQIYAVIFDDFDMSVRYAGMTASVRGAGANVTLNLTYDSSASMEGSPLIFVAYLRADGSEVSTSARAA